MVQDVDIGIELLTEELLECQLWGQLLRIHVEQEPSSHGFNLKQILLIRTFNIESHCVAHSCYECILACLSDIFDDYFLELDSVHRSVPHTLTGNYLTLGDCTTEN